MRQSVTLSQLAKEATRQAVILQGMDWEQPATQLQAMNCCKTYCKRVKAIFDIDLEPVVTWRAKDNRVTLDAHPKSNLDEAMLNNVIKMEQTK